MNPFPAHSSMPVHSIRRRLSVLGVLVLLALSACAKGTSVTPPAAQVGSDKITNADLQRNIPLFKFLTTLSQSQCGQPDTASHETAAAACARFTLTNLIQEDLIDTYAATNNISVSASDVTSTTSQLETRVGGHDKLVQLLAQQHVTFPMLQDLTKRLLLFNAVRHDIASNTVTDAQLHQTYLQSRAQYTQLHAAHILVQDQKTAEKISKQVTPKNFGDLAKKYSTDTGSASKGGDLGTVQAGQLDPTFVQAALSLKPGEISKPVQTQFGWHIIMLISAKVQSFKQVKTQLLDQAGTQSFDKWLADHLQAATIRVNPRYGHLDLQSGQIVPTTSTATGSATPAPSSSAPGSSPASPAGSPPGSGAAPSP
jgi:foldase protein PrsA